MSYETFEAPSMESLAELLPQYGIEAFIAQGGMGAVYKGCQLSLDRDVAIKVLPKELGRDADFRESFITEAKAMARLNHPNLLGVFDYGDVDGMPYIVMEYVEGGSLHEAAFDKAIDPKTAVAIVKGICDGLAHAHENGIVHRDIKPSNILLTKRAEPKVADFGLAQATDSAESGLMMGTPGYTAPEVFHDPSQANQLADIYSVGVILHQLLTGINPAGSFEPPSKPTGNPRLDAICRKATHIIPAQRHKSIHALASDLETWDSAAKAQQKPAIPAGPMARPPQKQPVKSAKSSGGGVLVKFLVIGILLAAGVYTYRFLQDHKEEPKQGIAVIKETGASDPADTTHVDTVPTPIPNPPDKVKHEPVPGPVTANTGTKEDPKLPPVVDKQPQPKTDKEPEPKPDKELPPGDPELRNRAIGLITDARKKRDKEFADNARLMVSKLDSSARNAKKEESAAIERLKKDIVDDRIPLTEGVSGLPDGLVNSFKTARAKEASILEGYSTALTRIRDAYVTRLQGAAKETAENELKSRLLAQAGSAKDLNTWVAQLSPEIEKVPKKSAIVFGSGNFAGKWNQSSDGGSADLIWIVHSDGGVEVEGKPWKGTWKIEDDGTLVVTWPDKPRPYVYNRDGNGWDGKTSFGQASKLTPAGS